jgi:Holliday junction resolvasome RuvABC endonuclease subunit
VTTTLSLDISSVSTGYAIFKSGKLKKYGIIDTSKIKRHSERLAVFEEALEAIIKKHKPKLIAAEDIYKGRNPKTHKVLALYHGVTYKLCYQYLKDDPFILYAGEIRSILSSAYDVTLKQKGVKDKLLTFDFIQEKYDFSEFEYKKHNDITDAIAIGLAIHDLESGSALEEFRGCARSRKKKKPATKKAKK